MKTEKPNGHCQECGDELHGYMKHLLRVCVGCSHLKIEGQERLKLGNLSRTAKGWA